MEVGLPARRPNTPRTRSLVVVSNFFLHLHPVSVPKRALRFSFTWGLGGLSLLQYAILIVTGILLTFYYVPDVDRAYESMKDLQFAVPYGVFLRNVHRWSAEAMVLLVILHMMCVFFTGSYKKPREFNWVVGVGLLVLTLLLSFTGYLLPWDQLAYWAVTVGTNMARSTPVIGATGPFHELSGARIDSDIRFALLGGTTVGQNALLRFYVLHCMAIPLVFCTLLAVHFWRVRKDGGISRPAGAESGKAPTVREAVLAEAVKTPGPPGGATYRLLAYVKGTTYSAKREVAGDEVATWPHLVKREFAAALAAIILLWLFSILVSPPLEEKANPALTPNPAKAPWYFAGLQELLVYFDPWIAGVMIPTLITLGLAAIPYLDTNRAGLGGVQLSRAKIRRRPVCLRRSLLVCLDLHRAVHARAELGLVLALGGLDAAERNGPGNAEHPRALGRHPPGRLLRPGPHHPGMALSQVPQVAGPCALRGDRRPALADDRRAGEDRVATRTEYQVCLRQRMVQYLTEYPRASRGHCK